MKIKANNILSFSLLIGLSACSGGTPHEQLPEGAKGVYKTNYNDYELVVEDDLFQMYDISTTDRSKSGGNLYDFHYDKCNNFLIKEKKTDSDGCDILVKVNYCTSFKPSIFRLCNYNKINDTYDKIIVHDDYRGHYYFYRDHDSRRTRPERRERRERN